MKRSLLRSRMMAFTGGAAIMMAAFVSSHAWVTAVGARQVSPTGPRRTIRVREQA